MKSTHKKKTVLITGASRGIGKALAKEFAAQGDRIILMATNIQLLQSLCAEIQNTGAEVSWRQSDVRDIQAMKESMDAVYALYGSIDIAILNAGVARRSSFANFQREDFDTVFEVNLHGVLNGMEALIPIMKEQGYGTIAGVSSLADARALPGNSAYVASKAALSHLLEAAAIELQAYNIHVLRIRPGFVYSDMTSGNRYPMPFVMSAEGAARIIYKGIIRNRSCIDFPFPMTLLSVVGKILPSWLWRRVFRIQKQEGT